METSWAQLEGAIENCHACRLREGRRNAVVGDGNRMADVMLVGEGPGAREDEMGLPFVGAAGQLLDRMLAAIGLDRRDVYICNAVKCRPPENRTPAPQECEACKGFLREQFRLVRPRIILCMGSTAARTILGPSTRVTSDRGLWRLRKGIWIMPTYHPAALLYDESKKRLSWQDLKLLKGKMEELGIYPERGEPSGTERAE